MRCFRSPMAVDICYIQTQLIWTSPGGPQPAKKFGPRAAPPPAALCPPTPPSPDPRRGRATTVRLRLRPTSLVGTRHLRIQKSISTAPKAGADKEEREKSEPVGR